MDKIILRDLALTTIVGTRPEERHTPRCVKLKLELSLDLSAAGASDDLMQSVNYEAVANGLLAIGREKRFFLIEALAEYSAAWVLREFPLVQSVKITLDKPGAIGAARSVAVEIERHR